jgi:hypothetical protein
MFGRTSGESGCSVPRVVEPSAIGSSSLASRSAKRYALAPDRGADHLMGPSMPRTPHVFGGLMWVNSDVLARSAPPIRRVVRHRVPTVGVPGCSRWPSMTPCCHSGKWVGSVA